MSKHSSDSELRREIACRLKEAIELNNLTRSQAAALLGVKRQTLWLYLNERSTPGGEVLRKAFELWGIKLTLGDFTITKESFGPRIEPDRRVPQQLNLIDQLEQLSNDQLEVKVIGRRKTYFELKVRIKASI